MTVAKTVKNAAKAVKNTARKVVKKIDKAVIEPVADMFHAKAKGHKKTSPAKSHSKSPAKKGKK